MTSRTVVTVTFALLLAFTSGAVKGQDAPGTDTVVVPLAKTSQIIFTIQDRRDIEVLKHYNFQELFQDIFRKLGDTTVAPSAEINMHEEPDTTSRAESYAENDRDNDDHKGGDRWEESRHGRIGHTWQSTNVDLGTNNYLADDQFPDGSEPYAVRPWGSWYVGVNSVQRVGPYVVYRISSKTKLVYESGGDRSREKNHDSFYLNNLRYGIRLQIGVRSTDIFVNYDMNDLFATDRGPKLNAISFGLIL